MSGSECDYENYLFDAQYDDDRADYFDCDEPSDLDGYPDLCGFVGTDDCYAPTDGEFMHEMHGPDNCGMYCQMRYEVRPYGHYAPTDVEIYHEMHGPDKCGENCVTRSSAGGPGDGDSDICERVVPLRQSSLDRIVSDVVGTDEPLDTCLRIQMEWLRE